MPAGSAGGHALAELGFELHWVGEELRGGSCPTPEMYVPGTEVLRTSILAAWTDTASGLVAVHVVGPRVPVTLELDVHVYASNVDWGTVRTVSRLIKAGKSVVVVGVEFTDDAGHPLAFGTGSFMVAPDPDLRMSFPSDQLPPLNNGERLPVPFAERVGCERRESGVAVLERSDKGLNASNTVNGGLIALAVEESALSATPNTTLSSMAMRYLRPVRLGPVVATAQARDGLARVEARDAGADKLAAYAITRSFASSATESGA